jgi:hypothetical protein
MSKFVDMLKRAQNRGNQTLGFRKPAEDKEKSSILLLADITTLPVKKLKEIVAAGVDGLVVFNGTLNESAPGEVSKTVSDVPRGIALTGDNKPGKISVKDGIDFVMVDLTAGPDLLAEEGLGRFLVISEAITPGMIKAINELGPDIDGVVIDFKNHKIDMQFILTCHLFSDILSKPLLVRLYQKSITDAELKALNRAGIKGLLLPGDIAVSGIKAIKKSIDSLPAVTWKSKSLTPLIPGMSISQKEPEQVEVEEEEEE